MTTPETDQPIAPGATIGILGGGQLGRMTALAGARLGYRSHGFDPGADGPLAQVAARFTAAGFDDTAALRRFARSVDVVTLEWENVPTAAVETVKAAGTPVRPDSSVLDVTQHRVAEKRFARAAGCHTAPFSPVTSRADLDPGASELGMPCLLKTARMGYDGKGQTGIETGARSEMDAAWAEIGRGPGGGGDAILERMVDFACEVSVIVARTPAGAVATYPAVENRHESGILRTTIAPADLGPYGLDSAAIDAAAREHAVALAERFDLAGLLGVEFFVTPHGRLLVNEMAPRPHNSGHWSFDAAVTSQFEQHVRAVCNLPLGPTDALVPARMENILGQEAAEWAGHVAEPWAKLHLYGKAEARPGRKMGHVTYLGMPDGSPPS